jgi:hypothetical protein
MGRDRIPVHSIQEMLSGGDLRSIGRVPEVLGVMEKNPERMNELVRCLESGDPVVRGRAADALEKFSATRPAARSRRFDGTWRRCCRDFR